MSDIKKGRCKDCIHFAILTLSDVGEHHHRLCPKYLTEKFPQLFYYEEAVNAFIPVPDKVQEIIDIDHSIDVDEEIEIRFKRFDMTDAEMDALPVE